MTSFVRETSNRKRMEKIREIPTERGTYRRQSVIDRAHMKDKEM